jgi:hypothetical protein
MKVTICPPSTAGRRSDDYQFSKRVRAISKESGLTFNDIRRMQTYTRSLNGGKHNPIPRWAMNDLLLRKVILVYLESRIKIGCQRSPVESQLTDAERLKAVRDSSLGMIFPLKCRLQGHLNQYAKLSQSGVPQNVLDRLQRHIENFDTQIVCLERGLDVIATAVTYLSYRLQYNSVQVAETLHLKPCHVRQIINRMNKAWTRISGEYPDGKYSPGGRRWGAMHAHWPPDRLRKLFVLRASGKSFKKCGKALGISFTTARQAFVNHFTSGKMYRTADRTKTVLYQRTADGGTKITYKS